MSKVYAVETVQYVVADSDEEIVRKTRKWEDCLSKRKVLQIAEVDQENIKARILNIKEVSDSVISNEIENG